MAAPCNHVRLPCLWHNLLTVVMRFQAAITDIEAILGVTIENAQEEDERRELVPHGDSKSPG